MRKVSILFLFMMLAVAFFFNSCLKEHQESLEGNWEKVNVVNIQSNIGHQWHFENNELTIYRYNKTTPETLILEDSGRFELRSGPKGLVLKIRQLQKNHYSKYNDDWTVKKLKKDILIMSLDLPGEVVYKEFFKIK
jgi:hypothetical protein